MKNLLSTAALAACVGLAACNAKPIQLSWPSSEPKKPAPAAPQTAAASQPKEATAPAPPKAAPTRLAAALAFPTGEEATSALLVEKTAPLELLVGQPFEYQVQVTNLTAITLSNVVLTDLLPADVTINRISPQAKLADGVGRWELGSFQPHEAKAIVVNATPQKVGTLDTCATISYDAGLCLSMPVVAPALQLALTAPQEVLLCDGIELRYVVENPGTGTARDVVVNGQLPAGLKTEDGRTSFAQRVGDLAPGKQRELVVKAVAARTGTYVHDASAAAGGGLTAKASEAKIVVRRPVLKIEKTGTERTFVGRDVKYAVTVTNAGDATARDTFIEDAIPAGMTLKSATAGAKKLAGGKVRWSLGDLAVGQSRTVEMLLTADRIGTADSKAGADAYCADAVADPHRTEVVGIPAILLEVVDLEDPIEVGSDATYEIRIRNQGSADATNVRIVCTLPENVQYVSAAGKLAGGVTGREVRFQPVASIAPQKEIVFRVVVRGRSAADARFKVALTSDQLQTPVEENEATNYYE